MLPSRAAAQSAVVIQSELSSVTPHELSLSDELYKIFTTETRRHREEKRFIGLVGTIVKLIQMQLGCGPFQRFSDLSDSVSPW